MSDYSRTYIKRLKVKGYRSLRDLELKDLPEIVVLHGPNGTGKSNILNAIGLAVRAMSSVGPHVPKSRAEAMPLTLDDADSRLALRRDDFTYNGSPEIRIAVEFTLGVRARRVLAMSTVPQLASLSLEVVFQDDGQRILHWFETANIDERFGIPHTRLVTNTAGAHVTTLLAEQSRVEAQLGTIQSAINQTQRRAARTSPGPLRNTYSEQLMTLQDQFNQATQKRTALVAEVESERKRLEQDTGAAPLVADRVRTVLVPELVHFSDAYRYPGNDKVVDMLKRLFDALLSDNVRLQESAAGLGGRLATAGLFGGEGTQAQNVELKPVRSTDYRKEEQVRLKHPTHGQLPLRNLGTGEQQLFFMLADEALNPSPVSVIEEPEAHLHRLLMEPLRRVLLASVRGFDGKEPEIDQLWIATHHHYFAIAPEFFDVSLDSSGATLVSRKERARDAVHFYEPGPLWEALRNLKDAGLDGTMVIFRRKEGNKPVTVDEIVASEQGDRVLFNEWAASASEQLVLSMKSQAEKQS